MKKRISVFLILCLLAGICAQGAYAAELFAVYEEEPEDCGAADAAETAAFLALVDEPALRGDLIAQASDCVSLLDVSAYRIPVGQVALLIHYIWYNIPELYHIRGQFAYSQTKSGYVRRLQPTYSRDAVTYQTEMTACETAAARLTAGMDDTMGEAEKALLLHDRIAQFCSYASAGTLSGDPDADAFLLPGALIKKSVVCSGYAMAFLYLGRQVGLRTYCCRSTSLNHAWNIVFLGETACHLDITWDDPAWDRAGRAVHSYCLLSSETFSQTHRAEDYDMTPDNASLDGMFLRDNTTAVVYADRQWYYLQKDSDGVCRILCSAPDTLFDNSDDTEILSYTAEWTVGTAVYGNYYACLSGDGRNVYYNTPDAVYRYSPATGQTKVFFVPDMDEDGKIFGFSYDGLTLTLDISDRGNYEGIGYTGRREIVFPDPDTCGQGEHTLQTVCGKTQCIYCGYEFQPEDIPEYAPERLLCRLTELFFSAFLQILKNE